MHKCPFCGVWFVIPTGHEPGCKLAGYSHEDIHSGVLDPASVDGDLWVINAHDNCGYPLRNCPLTPDKLKGRRIIFTGNIVAEYKGDL